jgi:hypothetical protein
VQGLQRAPLLFQHTRHHLRPPHPQFIVRQLKRRQSAIRLEAAPQNVRPFCSQIVPVEDEPLKSAVNLQADVGGKQCAVSAGAVSAVCRVQCVQCVQSAVDLQGSGERADVGGESVGR